MYEVHKRRFPDATKCSVFSRTGEKRFLSSNIRLNASLKKSMVNDFLKKIQS